MRSVILDRDVAGYSAGTQLRDVTLREARSWECNRCGACCNGLADNVNKDEATGLPLFVWGSNAPDDLYAERFGERLLQPIVLGDGGPEIGDAFEINNADGEPYTAFVCSQLRGPDGDGKCSCALYGKDNPADVSTMRPRNCGDFPVFGLAVDDTIIGGHPFVPPVGALPECTWYGIRVTGPWKDSDRWRERWERQQRGEPVPDLSLPAAWVESVSRGH